VTSEARALAVVLAPLAVACIEMPDEREPMCVTEDDCDHPSGEICAEGVCYGDPPSGVRFAAILVPPDYRSDLAVTELPELSISRDGTISRLGFAPAIEIAGRVLLACTPPEDDGCGPDASIGAQITIERASTIEGGPTWTRQVTATAGVVPGTAAFRFKLPRDGATYLVTIVPAEPEGEDELDAPPSPATLAPPRQLSIVADGSQTVEWYLGEPADLKHLTGCIENVGGSGGPYAGMRVSALGRWDAARPLERASSLAFADGSGCFDLVVPVAMLDTFDVIASAAPGDTMPTLRLFDEVVPDAEAVHAITPVLQMPNAVNPIGVALPVLATGTGGGSEPVPAADVRFATTFSMPSQPGDGDRRVEVRFEAQAVTSGVDADAPGVAELLLYPGQGGLSRAYDVTVVPPAGVEVAAIWDGRISIGASGGPLEPLLLTRRVGLLGTVTTVDGTPIAGAPVEVKLSTVFRWDIDDEALIAAAEAVPLASTTTGEQGEVFMWLDRRLLDATAYYDVEIKPASFDGPRWSFDGLRLPRNKQSYDLGRLGLPEASYARGAVVDPAGSPVPAAELRLYQIAGEQLCERALEYGIEPDACPPPAMLRGAFVADERGVVRPVLPSP
jgi:hypothetical protein